MSRRNTGLLPETRTRILSTLKRRGRATVDDLVQALDLSKTAVRAQLLRLEEQGLISRAVPPTPAKPGRPPLTFKVTGKGDSVFPSDDGALLTRLLRFLSDTGETRIMEDFFAELWREREAEYERRLGKNKGRRDSLASRLAAAKQVLAAGNFMPRIERATSANRDGAPGVCIRECHCPLPAAVRATRIPCKLEAKFLERVVGTAPERVRYTTPRDPVCSFEFPEPH